MESSGINNLSGKETLLVCWIAWGAETEWVCLPYLPASSHAGFISQQSPVFSQESDRCFYFFPQSELCTHRKDHDLDHLLIDPIAGVPDGLVGYPGAY